ncbi:hypothetical protein P8452_35307 [Trifolium repens]|nr:hypothetical protein P8452_35307 [Trifolium repens]
MEVVMFCFRILVFQRMGIGGGGVSTPPKVVVSRRCRRWCFGAGNWFHAFWFLFSRPCFRFALGGGGAMSFRSMLGFFSGVVAIFIACSVLRVLFFASGWTATNLRRVLRWLRRIFHGCGDGGYVGTGDGFGFGFGSGFGVQQ